MGLSKLTEACISFYKLQAYTQSPGPSAMALVIQQVRAQGLWERARKTRGFCSNVISPCTHAHALYWHTKHTDPRTNKQAYVHLLVGIHAHQLGFTCICTCSWVLAIITVRAARH